MGESKRWRRKYPSIIHKKQIDGEYLNECDKYDLMKLGFERKDAKRLLSAFAAVSGADVDYTTQSVRKSETQARANYAESFYSINTLSS